jgi:citrate lyase gamma subunit
LPLDSEGIPILTELVSNEELLRADDPAAPGHAMAGLTTAEIADELLSSEVFQLQLDEVASDLSRKIRLQVEQALGTAIEDVINEALDRNNARSFELIRVQLEDTLPEMLAKAIQDKALPA